MNKKPSLFSLESVGELLDVVLQAAVASQELDVGSVHPDPALLALLDVLFPAQRRKAPVLRDDKFLTPGELVLRSSQSFDRGGAVLRAKVSIERPEVEREIC